jgi:integrase
MAVVKHTGSPFLYYSFQLNGKKFFKSTKTANKALARQIEAKAYEQAVKDSTLGREAEPITLGDALEQFIDSKEGTPYHKVLVSVRNPLKGFKRCNKTKKQVKVYGLDFSTPLHLLKSADMNRLVEARRKEGSADATIKQHVCAVSGAWAYAKSLGYLVDDAISFPSFKRQRKQPVYLTGEEEQRLLASLDPKRYVHGYGHYGTRPAQRQQRLEDQYDFVVCLLDVGCRFSELAALTWKDVDLSKGVAYVYQIKTNKAHTIYLTERMIEVLQRRMQAKSHREWVFPNDDRDGPRTYHNCWFNRAVKRAGITGKKVTHHKLRSTFASKLAIAGVSLYKIQELLGHSSPEQTQVYAALQPVQASHEAMSVLNSLNARNLQR